MELDRKRELAFRYVQGELPPEEKAVVFSLILKEEAFRQLLKEELELKARMQQLRIRMNPELKVRLFADIRRRAAEEGRTAGTTGSEEAGTPRWLAWSEWTLKLTTPPLVYPVLKHLQRRCLT